MTQIEMSSKPRLLGQSNLRCGPIAYGLWRFVGDNTKSARGRIEAALEAGLTLIDVAAVYGLDWGGAAFGESETLLGRVLQEAPHLRARMVLATKFGIIPGIPYDSSATAILDSCEHSLRRLKTDVIDLFQVHRPDVLTHPAEVAGVLTRLREAGKIREVGVSNYTAAQTRALQAHLRFPLATHQPEFSALHLAPLSDGIFDQCVEHGMTPLVWSPLGGGKLIEPTQDPRVAAIQRALDTAAHPAGVDRAAGALAFVMAHPSQPIPIIGTQNPARMAAATDAFKVRLTRADWYAIAAAAGMPLP